MYMNLKITIWLCFSSEGLVMKMTDFLSIHRLHFFVPKVDANTSNQNTGMRRRVVGTLRPHSVNKLTTFEIHYGDLLIFKRGGFDWLNDFIPD